MRLQDIMTEGVKTVTASEPAERAWNRMRAERCHHLVVTREGAMVGVVSDRDLGGAHAARVRDGRTVAELMTESVVTARPTTTVREAANLLRGRSIGCLPVEDSRGKIVGIVTVSDLLELVGRGLERPVARTERRTLSLGPRQRRGGRIR